MRRSLCVVVAWLCGAVVGSSAPRPAIVQGPSQWTVQVGVEPLRTVALPAPGQGSPARYWYVLLRAENTASLDIDFHPRADLLTDGLALVPAGRGVPPEVFQVVKARHAGTHPFLEDLPFAGARILRGPDHARDFAVIWPDFSTEAKAVSLFIGGLSNETVALDHPTARDSSGGPAKVFLQKTLRLDFALEGQSDLRKDESIRLTGTDWVMR
ncbi:MAG: hypothetical protein KBE04_08245 [Phycisphaerae bacterium]|nr:hypothetical protein [Phycisphaerae bacterium]